MSNYCRNLLFKITNQIAIISALVLFSITVNADGINLRMHSGIKRVALVIGISKYIDENLNLKNPVNDARAIAETLKRFEFDTQLVLDANRSGVLNALEELRQKIGPSTEDVIVYFSGHGAEMEHGENYLFASDTKGKSIPMIESSSVSLKHVLGFLKKDDENGDDKIARVIILDACRNYQSVITKLLPIRGLTSKGLADMSNVAKGTLLVYSAAPGTVALDGEEANNSPFTAALINQINKNPEEEFSLLLRKVREEVEKQTKQSPIGIQSPWTNDNLKGAFYLKKPKIIDIKSVLRLEQESKALRGDKEALNLLRKNPEVMEIYRLLGFIAEKNTNKNTETFEFIKEIMVKDAIELYVNKANSGDTVSMTMLGKIYLLGIGVIKDEKQAYSWLQKAANAEYIDGMFSFGYILEYGIGVTKDEQQAANWYRRAANLGDVRSMLRLGYMYRTGTGVKIDQFQALDWFRKAADAGDSDGMVSLGGQFLFHGIKDEYKESLYWYQKAADAGNDDGMLAIGYMYEAGKGVIQDLNQALKWYRKAADAGNSQAMFNIGIMFDTGEGVKKDVKQALTWIRKAANMENTSAMLDLGFRYKYGKGVKNDEKQALYWYQRAADLGNEDAIYIVRKLREK